ncbi:MAG TPA: hypothetical protein VGI81_06830, partial [Tepidisphaeraceae bacterium]
FGGLDVNLPFSRTWWIEPGKILGGRYPGTQDPIESRRMLDALLAMGVCVFVNLQQADELGRGGRPFPDYRPAVTELAQARGVQVRFHRFPIPDLSIPSRQTMTEIQSALRQAVAAGELAYVHCWGGHGRTGTVAGCWLVAGGASLTEALRLMRERRSHDAHLAGESAPQTDEQRRFIQDWHAGTG